MNNPPNNPKKADDAAPVMLACKILISGTKIGKARYGRGTKINLPDAEAKALAGLSPPAVHIDGIPSL